MKKDTNALVEQKSVLAKLMASENITVEHKKIPTAAFDIKNRCQATARTAKGRNKKYQDRKARVPAQERCCKSRLAEAILCSLRVT